MKRNGKQMWRSVISIVLALTLVFGMSTTAFATTGAAKDASALENIQLEDMTAEELEVAIDELYDLVVTYGPGALEDAWAYAEQEGYIEQAEAALAELKVQAEAAYVEYDTVIKPQIEAQIAELEAQLAVLEAAAKEAAGKAQAEIDAQIAAIEAQIAELEALLAEIEEGINTVIDAVQDADAAMKDLVKAIKNFDAEGTTTALKDIQAALNQLAGVITVIEDTVADINGAIDEAIAVVEAIDAAVKAIEDAINTTIDAVNTAIDNAVKAVKEIKAQIEKTIADIDAAVKETVAAIETLYINSTTADYTVTEDSYYVALGDLATTGSDKAAYGTKLAAALGLDAEQYSAQGIEGLRAEDLRAILDANYTADAYGQALFGADIEALRAELTAEIAKADLITVGFGNNAIINYTLAQLDAKAEMDWARYVGADGAAAIADAIAELNAYLAETMGAEAADLVTTAIESYAYAYVGFVCNYPEAVNAIKAINPDAQVVLVGMYNPMENAAVEVEGVTVPVGEFVGALVDLCNVHYTAYAMATGNAIYVDAADVEMAAPFTGAMDPAALTYKLLNADTDLVATAAGHEYIAAQIMNALNVTEDKDDEVIEDNTDEINKLNERLAAIKAVLKLTKSGTTATVKVENKSTVKATWAAVETATAYNVVLYKNGKVYSKATVTDTAYTKENVTRGCTYTVAVTPVAEFEGDNYYGIVKTSKAVKANLEKATLKVKKTGKKVKVTSKDQNSTGYQIYISKDKKFKKNVKKVKVATKEKALNKKLATKKYFKSGKNYVKVRAYTKVNGKTVYGKWSKVKTVKVK